MVGAGKPNGRRGLPSLYGRTYWVSVRRLPALNRTPGYAPARFRESLMALDFQTDRLLMRLTIGVGCCARAASGHAAAPPSSVMNLRLLIRSPRRRARAADQARRCQAPSR